jgi:hypothetical protein
LDKIPFQIYDFIGIIIPGGVVVFTIKMMNPDLFTIITKETGFYIIFFIVTSFIFGHLIQDISRSYFLKVIRWLKFGNYSSSKIKASVFDNMPNELQNNIEQALREFYNLTQVKGDMLESLCYSPVYDRMINRNTFVALADFQRSLSFLSFSGTILTLICYVYNIIDKGNWIDLPLFSIIILLSFACFQFLKGYITFTKIGAQIVIQSFFSWWREKTI